MGVQPEVDDVVVAVPPSLLMDIRNIVSKLEHLSVPVRAILDFGSGISFQNTSFHFGDVTLLDLKASPSESITYSILKRSFDLAFSAVVVILTAPLMLLIAVAIRLTSPGPILFVQDRVGLNGRCFVCTSSGP